MCMEGADFRCWFRAGKIGGMTIPQVLLLLTIALIHVQSVGGSLASSSIPSLVWVCSKACARRCPVRTRSWDAKTSLSTTWRMACEEHNSMRALRLTNVTQWSRFIKTSAKEESGRCPEQPEKSLTNDDWNWIVWCAQKLHFPPCTSFDKSPPEQIYKHLLRKVLWTPLTRKN